MSDIKRQITHNKVDSRGLDHLTMVEGGVVYTNSVVLNRLILLFRDWGMTVYAQVEKIISADIVLIQHFTTFE